MVVSAKSLLVIGAHSADFVWRAAGTIAVITSQGGAATVLALSYGERGESGELWQKPNQTVENVKRIRHQEAAAAAAAEGATFRCLDLGDYPLHITGAAMEQLVEVFRQAQPTFAWNTTSLSRPGRTNTRSSKPSFSICTNRAAIASRSPMPGRAWSLRRIGNPSSGVRRNEKRDRRGACRRSGLFTRTARRRSSDKSLPRGAFYAAFDARVHG